ncbi:KPN_02809 family neutral zinc metallopeptidase [Methylobacterium sp. Leaf118]|uniref:KPN_02809 family neutral zinc metallopeptidase n=1 Tax=Methylobacterium sp. Leaf118 TaxID=2876562 RepID=UPI001E48E933|nr:neutral zinc metallopeptidase [Methylobacterium sp. Leaf118]
MRWDDFRASDNVEDRRGEGGGGGGGFPGGGAGGLGIGAIVIVLLISWVTGINPAILMGGAEQITGGGRQREERVDPETQAKRRQAPTDQTGQFAAKILGNTEDVWKEILPNQTGRQYTPAKMVLYQGGTRSGCGNAQAAMGPFYCPIDKTVYLDTSFFQEMRTKFGVKGEFAYAYVIAHEIGHHIQDVLGILGKVQSRQQAAGDKREANQLSVRVELMADCLAGVWAKNSNDRWNSLDPSDIQEALKAASAIGDDKLQEQSQGYAVPDSFTHGSSEQRMRWFMTGYKSGQTKSCDTFRASRG